MKKWFVVGLLILTSSVLTSCSEDSAADQKQTIERHIPVKTMWIKLKPFSEYLKVTGTVKARNQIRVVAEEAGTLEKILKDKGSYVRRGDTLAVLDNQIVSASFRDTRAALHQAEIEFKSKSVLYEQKAISELEFLASKYGLERAQAAYDLARARYNKLFIRAPISGFINSRYFDKGAYIMPPSPLFDLIDNSTVKIQAGVAERFLADIHKDSPVEITFDAFPDMKIDAPVTFVSQSIDPVSRTFEIEIELENPQRKLAPEMIANLNILRKQYSDRVVVPLDALIESEAGRYVFVNQQGVAKRLPVQIVSISRDSVLVEGLQPDSELIVVGQQEVSDGDLLLVKNDAD